MCTTHNKSCPPYALMADTNKKYNFTLRPFINEVFMYNFLLHFTAYSSSKNLFFFSYKFIVYKPLRISNVVTPITKLTITALLAVSRFIKIVAVCAVDCFIAIVAVDEIIRFFTIFTRYTTQSQCDFVLHL